MAEAVSRGMSTEHSTGVVLLFTEKLRYDVVISGPPSLRNAQAISHTYRASIYHMEINAETHVTIGPHQLLWRVDVAHGRVWVHHSGRRGDKTRRAKAGAPDEFACKAKFEIAQG